MTRRPGLTGATRVITTNPWRRKARRPDVFLENLRRFQGIFESVPNDFQVVRNAAEYRAARASGKHAAFLGIQGGNALDRDPGRRLRAPAGFRRTLLAVRRWLAPAGELHIADFGTQRAVGPGPRRGRLALSSWRSAHDRRPGLLVVEPVSRRELRADRQRDRRA